MVKVLTSAPILEHTYCAPQVRNMLRVASTKRVRAYTDLLFEVNGCVRVRLAGATLQTWYVLVHLRALSTVLRPLFTTPPRVSWQWLDVDRSGVLEADEFLPLFVQYATGSYALQSHRSAEPTRIRSHRQETAPPEPEGAGGVGN